MEDYIYPLIFFIIWIISRLMKKQSQKPQSPESEGKTEPAETTRSETPLESFLKQMFQEPEEENEQITETGELQESADITEEPAPQEPSTESPDWEISAAEPAPEPEPVNLSPLEPYKIGSYADKKFTYYSWKKAIILKEILDTPVSMRYIRTPFMRR